MCYWVGHRGVHRPVRGAAPTILGVRVSTVAQQELDDLGMTLARRKVQRCPARDGLIRLNYGPENRRTSA